MLSSPARLRIGSPDLRHLRVQAFKVRGVPAAAAPLARRDRGDDEATPLQDGPHGRFPGMALSVRSCLQDAARQQEVIGIRNLKEPQGLGPSRIEGGLHATMSLLRAPDQSDEPRLGKQTVIPFLAQKRPGQPRNRLLISGGSYGTTNAWEVATGRHLVTLFAFPERRNGMVKEEWLAYHPDGYYDGSPGVERLLAWRVGDELLTPEALGPRLHRPDRLADALGLRLR